MFAETCHIHCCVFDCFATGLVYFTFETWQKCLLHNWIELTYLHLSVTCMISGDQHLVLNLLLLKYSSCWVRCLHAFTLSLLEFPTAFTFTCSFIILLHLNCRDFTLDFVLYCQCIYILNHAAVVHWLETCLYIWTWFYLLGFTLCNVECVHMKNCTILLNFMYTYAWPLVYVVSPCFKNWICHI